MSRKSSLIKKIIYIVGCIWAVLAWPLWIFSSHRGVYTAMWAAIILAPSYLFISIEKNKGYPIRIFTATATAVLLLVILKLLPDSINILTLLLLPPCAAITAKILIPHGAKKDFTSADLPQKVLK